MSRQTKTARRNGQGAAQAAPAAQKQQTRLHLGGLYVTQCALKALKAVRMAPETLLTRHASGDFGEVTIEEKGANAIAFHSGGQVFSVYRLDDGETVWVVTDGPRRWRLTTISLPHDYF